MQRRLLFTIGMATAVLIAAPSLAAPDRAQPAQEHLTGNQLMITPGITYQGATLRIAGPEGYELTKRFGGGPMAVNLFADGASALEALPTGRYRYEVVFDTVAGQRPFTGTFWVENGVTVSRDHMMSRLADVRADLNEDPAFSAAQSGASSLEGPGTEGYVASDFVLVDDTADDGTTYMEIESFQGSGAGQADWEFRATGGDIRIVQEGGTGGGVSRLTILEGGGIGLNTTAPQDIMHAVSGKSNSFVRIENTSSGETWRFGVDSGGDFVVNLNATNGNGSTGNKFEISDANGNIGLKTGSPSADLHIFQTDDELNERVFVKLQGSNFAPQFEYIDGSSGDVWREGMNNAGDFVINQTDDLGVAEMLIKPDGRVIVNGTQVHPDYVFDESYQLMDLTELAAYVREKGHLPGVTSSDEAAGTVDLSSFPLQLLEKIEELTLYTIEQEEKLVAKNVRIESLEARLAAIEARLASQSR